MFEPQFTYTPKIVNELGKIERFYGQLLGEKLVPSMALKLAEENQILATHHSTSIEGNPLSPRDVTNIVLGDQIPTTKSEKEVKNYFAVLNSIFLLAKKYELITTELTKKLHRELMEGLVKKDLGEFRNAQVFIGHRMREKIVVKHTPPFHKAAEIEMALQELYTWLMASDSLHPLIKAGILHHQFAYLHPFFDGNGRLARILTSYYLLLKNYEVVKYFIMDDYYDIDRQLYSDKLHSADPSTHSTNVQGRPEQSRRTTGSGQASDKTEWLEYFFEGIGFSLQAAFTRIQNLKKGELEELKGEKRILVTPREEEVLQIVLEKKAIKTKDIEDALSVTRQQAHALLHSLVKKELLTKFGKTKSSYYVLR